MKLFELFDSPTDLKKLNRKKFKAFSNVNGLESVKKFTRRFKVDDSMYVVYALSKQGYDWPPYYDIQFGQILTKNGKPDYSSISYDLTKINNRKNTLIILSNVATFLKSFISKLDPNVPNTIKFSGASSEHFAFYVKTIPVLRKIIPSDYSISIQKNYGSRDHVVIKNY